MGFGSCTRPVESGFSDQKTGFFCTNFTEAKDMTGETLMVLKRIFATALGALGLGALAAGPTAFAQSAGEGNIPAPNIFDDQITCSMLVPTAMTTTPSQPTVIRDGLP